MVATARTAEEGESRLSGTLTETIDRINKAGGEARFVKADLAQQRRPRAAGGDRRRHLRPGRHPGEQRRHHLLHPGRRLPREALQADDGGAGLCAVPSLAAGAAVDEGAPHRLDRQHLLRRRPSTPSRPTRAAGRGGTVYGMCKAALERFTTGLAVGGRRPTASRSTWSRPAWSRRRAPGPRPDHRGDPHRVQPIEYIAEAVFQLYPGTRDPDRPDRLRRAVPEGLAIQPRR